MAFKVNDSNTLLIGDSANTDNGALYQVKVQRGADKRIIGFNGNAIPFSDAQFNDAGIAYGPKDKGGVLFLARSPSNQIGEIKQGSNTTEKVLDLQPFGVNISDSGLNFVPSGFPGKGKLELVSYIGGQRNDIVLSGDGNSIFDIAYVNDINRSRRGGGPKGFTFVPA